MQKCLLYNHKRTESYEYPCFHSMESSSCSAAGLFSVTHEGCYRCSSKNVHKFPFQVLTFYSTFGGTLTQITIQIFSQQCSTTALFPAFSCPYLLKSKIHFLFCCPQLFYCNCCICLKRREKPFLQSVISMPNLTAQKSLIIVLHHILYQD